MCTAMHNVSMLVVGGNDNHSVGTFVLWQHIIAHLCSDLGFTPENYNGYGRHLECRRRERSTEIGVMRDLYSF
jgi:hypothetical protein